MKTKHADPVIVRDKRWEIGENKLMKTDLKMDKPTEVTREDHEMYNSTLHDRLNIPTELQRENVKQENYSSVNSEIYIKTEPYDDDNELPDVASTSHDTCSNDDIKLELFEPMIQIEYTENDKMQSSLDVGNQIKAKKRKRNTSEEQYLRYVEEMEEDYYFRSGTKHPLNHDSNYLTKKWAELTKKLNAIGSGPQLTIQEWKKRFKDWKNTTRAKHRKMMDHRRKSGERLPCDLQLSHTEERAITVWSQVAQTGTDVPEERIQEQRSSSVPDSQNLVADNSKLITAPKEIIENSQTENTSKTPVINNPTTSNKIMHISDSKSVRKPINKPFSPVQNSTNTYENSEKIKLDLEKEKLYLQNKELKYKIIKLQFEIAKYKYENKDFEFNVNF